MKTGYVPRMDQHLPGSMAQDQTKEEENEEFNEIEDLKEAERARWMALSDRNSDICAWLQIDGADIDYPVVQTDNNDDYLKLNLDRKYDYYGTVFADYACDAAEGRNIILYGHNMMDSLMFGSLRAFRDAVFFEGHRSLRYQPYNSPAVEYVIFSVFITTAYPQNGEPNYRQITFSGDEDFAQWVAHFAEKSMHASGIDPAGITQVITLSTCEYDFADARLVVMAGLLL